MSEAGAAGASTRRHRRRAPPGSTPGTLIPDPDAQRPRVQIIGYGPDDLEERTIERIEEIEPLIGRWPVTWVNVEGLADLDLIRGLGELFGLHRLALEDVVNVHQRAKVEEYEDHLFIVTRMVEPNAAPETEQMTLFLDERCLLTFQERHGDGFDPIRERIRRHRGQIRGMGPDYLAYALLDTVIDGYFPVLEAYGEDLEEIEDAVMSAPESARIGEIHGLKRDLLSLRRAVWPQRDMIHALGRDGLRYVSDQTRLYLRDCYDHTVQLIDVLETYREIASGLVDIYLSSVSARMNEVMKVLTIIATIFIPLGFVAGVYGMNFDPEVSPWNMPELRWAFGYPLVLGIMALIAVGLLGYFRAKGWIGGPRSRR